MLKEFLEKLLELKRPEVVKVNDRDYSTINLEPVYEPNFKGLEIFNLDSLVTYIKDDPDALKQKHKLINIISPTKILLQSSIYGDFKRIKCENICYCFRLYSYSMIWKRL